MIHRKLTALGGTPVLRMRVATEHIEPALIAAEIADVVR
jgi:hypothetical protein